MGKRVALVLGSGGARGYTHIGVIDELVARGYEIAAISGCSWPVAVDHTASPRRRSKI